MNISKHLTIIGGGPAGLSVAFYAKQAGIPFTVYEAADCVGGNAITLERDGLLFDSGAHRFHDKDVQSTRDVLKLMGEDVHLVNAPSTIYYQGSFLKFPLTPFNLLARLGPKDLITAMKSYLATKISRSNNASNFKTNVLNRYGRFMAENFLLNYSEKLWGVTADRLLPEVSGGRLKGLSLKNIIAELLTAGKYVPHMEGKFYYPKKGIGDLFEKMKKFCGEEHIKTGKRVTGLLHDNQCIKAIEINGEEKIKAEVIVSTLPNTLLAKGFSPSIPDLSEKLSGLRFRHVMLVVLIIDKPSVTAAASIYFPGEDFLFTRVVEPKNRSKWMAPANKTALVAEVPYFELEQGENELIEKTIEQLEGAGLLKKEQVINNFTYNIPYAYPVLEQGVDKILNDVNNQLKTLENLHVLGRGATFSYTHIHDMMAEGRKLVASLR